MLSIYDVIKRARVTEKTMAHLDASNTYVFEVHPKANKIQIRRAVEGLFDVKVLSVNTSKMPGKPRRRGRQIFRTSSWKKAYVKLQEGDAIELF